MDTQDTSQNDNQPMAPSSSYDFSAAIGRSHPSANRMPSPSEPNVRRVSKTMALVASSLTALIVLGMGSFYTIDIHKSAGLPMYLPTIDGQAIRIRQPLFTASIVGEKNNVRVHYFTEQEVSSDGIEIYRQPPTADDPGLGDHILVRVSGATSGMRVSTLFCGPDTFKIGRGWGYGPYTGNETETNFDGDFFVFDGEPGFKHLDTRAGDGGPKFVEDGLYYIMLDEGTIDHCTIHSIDTDADGLSDSTESHRGTNPDDADTDDDGLSDFEELIGVMVGGVNIFPDPTKIDSDEDGIQDGTELGRATGSANTDPNVFIPDADPTTTTHPLQDDTDGGGERDGEEDQNANGMIDVGESDPLDPSDDMLCSNGRIDPNEACDDGNLASGDGCTELCIVEDAWFCTGEPSACVTIPNLGICGNGVLNTNEACDDNNADDADGCSSSCAIEDGWACDGEPSDCLPLPGVG